MDRVPNKQNMRAMEARHTLVPFAFSRSFVKRSRPRGTSS